jgi:peptidyl-tRNA hydrolase
MVGRSTVLIKQVILVPTYLGMSPGKVASQCCHVAVPFNGIERVGKRIILRVESRQHMESLKRLAEWVEPSRSSTIAWSEFIDSAPTTEGTEGQITAVSVIADEVDVDLVTGHLELY